MFQTAVDAHFECLYTAPGGAASPRRRRFACMAGCSLGRSFYIGAAAGALRCSKAQYSARFGLLVCV